MARAGAYGKCRLNTFRYDEQHHRTEAQTDAIRLRNAAVDGGGAYARFVERGTASVARGVNVGAFVD